MSKEYSSVLAKLEKSLGKNKPKQRIDFKELAEEKKRKFLKLKKGKNEVVFINPSDVEDPFILWGIHNGLQEVAYWSIPCDKENKEENCIVCNVIEDLKTEDYNKNKHIWYPIRQQIEYYAPVIDVTSESTIAEGLKWLRISKSIMGQLTEWLKNVDHEDGELDFYHDDAPQKVIINYDPTEPPVTQYKVDKKNYKGFTESQLETWRLDLKLIPHYNLSKSVDETKKILDGYLERVLNDVSTDEDKKEPAEDKNDSDSEGEKIVLSKLSSLKKK